MGPAVESELLCGVVDEGEATRRPAEAQQSNFGVIVELIVVRVELILLCCIN